MKDISTMVDIMEEPPKYTPVQYYAVNGRPIPFELIDQNAEFQSFEGIGECAYPLACCVDWRRGCNRCPHLERYWP